MLGEHTGISGDVAQRRPQIVGYGIGETLQLNVCLRLFRRPALQLFIRPLQILFRQIALAGLPMNHKALHQKNKNRQGVSTSNDDLHFPRAGRRFP
jgi:hypothetical protein